MLALNASEYASFYQPYIDVLEENSNGIIKNLEDSLHVGLCLLEDLTEEKQLFRYADGKWTIKELVQHIIDSERVFSYRALVFSRKDIVPLPGFEESDYVKNSRANERPYDDLLEELKVVRLSTILLFKSFNKADLQNSGNASGKLISVRALGYITSGHLLHHLKIIKQRYLV